MRIYEVYRSPEADMAKIEKLCSNAQILMNKLEEAKEAGVTLCRDYVEIALELANSSHLSVKENQPAGVTATIGFQIVDEEQDRVLYEALFLPRANSGIMHYLGAKFLDGDEVLVESRISPRNSDTPQEMAREIQENIEWLGGDFSISGKGAYRQIFIKLADWDLVHAYYWHALSNACYGIEHYISNNPSMLEDESERAKLWKRYFGLKNRFETSTFLTERCHKHCSLCYYGSFVVLEQLNSIPVWRFGCVDFSNEGMDKLERLLAELESIARQ